MNLTITNAVIDVDMSPCPWDVEAYLQARGWHPISIGNDMKWQHNTRMVNHPFEWYEALAYEHLVHTVLMKSSTDVST